MIEPSLRVWLSPAYRARKKAERRARRFGLAVRRRRPFTRPKLTK